MHPAAVRFVLFVSPVAGRLVSRPGAPHSFIGAHVPGQEGGDITWQSGVVVAIAEPEYLRYSREWDQLIRLGDLRKRTEEEWKTYSAATEKAETERSHKLAEEAKKLTEEASKKLEAAKKAESEHPKAHGAGVQE